MPTKSDRHAMVEVKCEWCSSPFMARKQRVDMGLGRFCSKECFNNYQREKAKDVYGMKHGHPHFDSQRKMWGVSWSESDGKVHSTSYPHWWWLMNKGKIPDGYLISYIDGNKENIDPSNFECIPMGKAHGKGGHKQLGYKRSNESKEKMSKARTGMKLSDEHRKHIGDANKIKWANGVYDNIVFKDISGDKNPGWRGGVGQEYPPEFNRRLIKFIWERDRETCQICGRAISKGTYMGHVHHIDGNKKNNDYDNLILLCKHCHGKIHKSYDVSSPVIMAFRSKLEWNQPETGL